MSPPGVAGKIARLLAKLRCQSQGKRASSVGELIPSFVNTLRRWKSSVRVLRNGCAPTSRVCRPARQSAPLELPEESTAARSTGHACARFGRRREAQAGPAGDARGVDADEQGRGTVANNGSIS